MGSITFLTLSLSWEQEDMDVREDSTWSNSGVGHEFVKFFIVSDGQLDVSGHNSSLFVVFGSVSSKFEYLSSEIFEDGSEIDWGTSSNSFSVSALFQESSDSSDWELKSSFGWSWNGSLSRGFSSSTFSFSGHFDDWFWVI